MRQRHGLVYCICWVVATPALMAQAPRKQPAPAVKKFDVVSIKPCSGGEERRNWSPTRLSLECVSVETLIRAAYLAYPDGKPWPIQNGMKIAPVSAHQLQQQFKGSPKWMQSERYTIDAKTEAPTTEEMMRGPMMQELLKDRFRLSVHREPHEVAVYDLLVAKDGPKFQRARPGGCTQLDPAKPPPPRARGQAPTFICGGIHVSEKGGLDGESVTLYYLCSVFAQALDRPVVDKTGLTETYDLHLGLTYAELGMGHSTSGGVPSNDPAAPPKASEPGGSIYSALRKLGLQLQPGKMLEELIVIDRVERPVGN
jgi:uncharacterized protein (TIGR03435 family)